MPKEMRDERALQKEKSTNDGSTVQVGQLWEALCGTSRLCVFLSTATAAGGDRSL